MGTRTLTQAVFVPPGPPTPGASVTVRIGQPVPPGFVVMDRSITATIANGYLVMLTQTLPDSAPPSKSPTSPVMNPVPSVTIPPPPIPPGTFSISRGGVYITTTGTTFMVPAGTPVPSGWRPEVGTPAPVMATTATLANVLAAVAAPPAPSDSGVSPAGWDPINTDDPTQPVSSGETYVAGDGTSIVIPAGTPVPADWKPITSLVDLEPMPMGGTPIPKANITLVQILEVAAVLGVAGIGVLSVLVATKPDMVRGFLGRFEAFKNVVVDASQLLMAAAIIVTIGFVAYEFAEAYKATGSVAGAIGKLAASTIETMVLALVDTLEQLAKDAFTWMKDEIGSLF